MKSDLLRGCTVKAGFLGSDANQIVAEVGTSSRAYETSSVRQERQERGCFCFLLASRLDYDWSLIWVTAIPITSYLQFLR